MSLIGLGDEPRDTGKAFYVYYNYAPSAEWGYQGNLMPARRLLTFQEDNTFNGAGVPGPMPVLVALALGLLAARCLVVRKARTRLRTPHTRRL